MTSILTVMYVLLGASFLWLVLPFCLRHWQSRKLAAICAKKKAIVLTYDDGPSPMLSGKLSELLARNGVPATFFLIGKYAMGNQDMVKKLQQDGHEIGSHTYDHSNAWKVSPRTSLKDFRKGHGTLEHITGSEIDLFRPPFGKTTLANLLQGYWHSVRFAYWTIDSQDSWNRRPVEDVLRTIKDQQGGVVLMHDFEKPPRGPSPEQHGDYVLELTQSLITAAAENGLTFMPFSELFKSTSRAGS